VNGDPAPPPVMAGAEEYERSLGSVGRGAGIMAITTVLLLAFSFVGRVAVARIYGQDAWGEFNIGLAVVGLLSLTALLGLHQALARALSFENDAQERRALIRWTILVTVAASVIVSAAVFLLAGLMADAFHAPALTIVLQLFSVAIGFTMLSSLLASIFQGFEDTVPNGWFNGVVAPGLFLVFLGVVYEFHWSFAAAMAAYSASLGVALGLLVGYTIRRLPRYLPPVVGSAGRPRTPLWNLSLGFWGITSLAFVTAFVDTIVLGIFRSTGAVGLYSSAMTLARLLLIGNGALTYIYLPVAARLSSAHDTETIRRTYVTSTRWTLAITLPMFLVFFFLPSQSLTLVFGGGYQPASEALVILVIGSFVSVILGPVNSCLGGMGYVRTLLLTTVVSAVLNLALSLALIPLFGLLGAAVAWAVARAAYPGSGIWALFRTDRITPFGRILVVPVVISLAVGVPLFYGVSLLGVADWLVVPLYLAGVLVFIAVILATRSLDPGDLVAATALERAVGRPLPGLRRFLGTRMNLPRTGTDRGATGPGS
jgi:O-antigen/teichoic acid export membrane protein